MSKIVDTANEKLNDLATLAEDKKKRQSISEMLNNTTEAALKTLSGQNIGRTENIPDNLIAFMSVAGGAGATTTVVNLASTFRKLGKTVLVVDFNILNPAILHYIPYVVKDEKSDLVGYLMGDYELGDAICNGDIALLTARARTLDVFVRVDTGAVAKVVEDTLHNLRTLFDVVLIDIPTNFVASEIVSTALNTCDRLYLVWNETIDCIANTEALRMNMAVSGIEYESKMRSIILNQRTNVFYSAMPIEKLNLKIDCVLPFELGIRESCLRQEIFVVKGLAHSGYAKAYCSELLGLANKILEECGRANFTIDSTILRKEVKKSSETSKGSVEDMRENLDDLIEEFMDELTEEDEKEE